MGLYSFSSPLERRLPGSQTARNLWKGKLAVYLIPVNFLQTECKLFCASVTVIKWMVWGIIHYRSWGFWDTSQLMSEFLIRIYKSTCLWHHKILSSEKSDTQPRLNWIFQNSWLSYMHLRTTKEQIFFIWWLNFAFLLQIPIFLPSKTMVSYCLYC